MILLLVTICVSVPVALGIKWLNIKDVSREREKRKAAAEESITIVRDDVVQTGEMEKVV